MTKEDATRAKLLDDEFNAVDVSKSYECMSDQFYKVFDEVQTFYKKKREQSETRAEKDDTEVEEKSIYHNIETSILKEDKIAYIEIKSF